MVEHIRLSLDCLNPSFYIQDNLHPTRFTQFMELYNKLLLTPFLDTFDSQNYSFLSLAYFETKKVYRIGIFLTFLYINFLFGNFHSRETRSNLGRNFHYYPTKKVKSMYSSVAYYQLNIKLTLFLRHNMPNLEEIEEVLPSCFCVMTSSPLWRLYVPDIEKKSGLPIEQICTVCTSIKLKFSEKAKKFENKTEKFLSPNRLRNK